MHYSFERPLLLANGDPVIIDQSGKPVVFIRVDDVWGPDEAVIPGHENARFILALLNGEPIEFPKGATPGPWRIEEDTCATDAGIPDRWFLTSSGSPEGTELLAFFDTPLLDIMNVMCGAVMEFVY